MNLRDRIGYDAGSARLKEALAWAAANGFHYRDFNADRTANHLLAWNDERVKAVRATCERHEIQLGLRTACAVNVAELSPLVSDAVDATIDHVQSSRQDLSAGEVRNRLAAYGPTCSPRGGGDPHRGCSSTSSRIS